MSFLWQRKSAWHSRPLRCTSRPPQKAVQWRCGPLAETSTSAHQLSAYVTPSATSGSPSQLPRCHSCRNVTAAMMSHLSRRDVKLPEVVRGCRGHGCHAGRTCPRDTPTCLPARPCGNPRAGACAEAGTVGPRRARAQDGRSQCGPQGPGGRGEATAEAELGHRLVSAEMVYKTPD